MTQRNCNRHVESFETLSLLVVENDVGKPNVLGWNVELGYAAVFSRIPFEFMILPLVLQPDVGRKNLIFQIL